MATPEAPLREILKAISFTQLPLCHIEPLFTPEPILRPQLHVYRPFNTKAGTPASDVECLRVVAALKFRNHDFDIKYTSEPNASPNGQLPFLLMPDRTAVDCAHIEEHMAKHAPACASPGDGLLQDQLAYYSLVKCNLVPAAEYLAWVDPVGFETIADAKYLSGYSAVARYFLGWMRSSAVARKLQLGLPEYGAALDGDVLYENALRALDSILVLLGDRKFLAGEDVPGPLDALVFACLNAFLESPAKSSVSTELTRAESKYAPLFEYTRRINKLYFPSKREEHKEPRSG